MFRPAKIHHLNIVIRDYVTEKLIVGLHENGLCELKASDSYFETKFSHDKMRDFTAAQARLKYVTDILDDYKPIIQPEKLAKKLFSPSTPKKRKVKNQSPDKILEIVHSHLEKIELKVTQYNNQLKETDDKIKHNNFLISNLYNLPDVRTDILKSSENFSVFVGIITEGSLNKLKDQIIKNAVMGVKHLDKEMVTIIVFSTPEHMNKIERLIHEEGVEVLNVPYADKKPIEIIQNLKGDNNNHKDEIRTIKSHLKELESKYHNELNYLAEELEISTSKVEALRNFKGTNSFSTFEAWIPFADFDKFKAFMDKEIKYYYMEQSERDDAPTKLNNIKIVKPFESILGLFSLPKYGQFDPTPLLAFFFTMFFGFMLDDFFYGLLLLIIAFIMMYGVGKYDDETKSFGLLMMFFGISTMVWGVFFGAYFGNFFQLLGINLPIIVDAMKDVMTALYIAIGIGALHLMVGLVSGFVDNLYMGKIRDALHKQLVWILFMISMGMFVFQMQNIGLVLLGLSIFMQILFTFLEAGGVSAVLSVFSFSGFLGDLFSYARLMALGIGTSGISLAVNFMVFLALDMIPYVGIVFAIMIFIGGHLFNLAMNGLGAFIHSTRLHFLEFFTKFYDGGGRAYTPFKAKRKTTIIE